jgi:hypothetical protein
VFVILISRSYKGTDRISGKVQFRPDIRQSPVPARYPAPFSSSGSGLAEENFAGFLLENVCFLRACFFEKFNLL